MNPFDISNGLIEDVAAVAIRQGASSETGLNFSIAISLKRIADVLTDSLVVSDEETERSPTNRIAAAMEKFASRIDHVTDYFGYEKAQLRVSAPKADER